jgi:NAD(P)-dependent dehydrogenase (short-subunit alcohol dehydrogenase family)
VTGSTRTLLVTGTSTGIGQATAVRAAAAGWQVVATMRDPSRDDALRDEASRHGVDLDVMPLDVTDAGSVADCLAEVRERHGRLDAVVNNAGISNFDPTMEMSTLDALRANLEVNFVGVVAVSRLAMPLLRRSRGRLVTIGSVHGVVGQPFNEAYAAAKFAVEGFMESLAPVAAAHGVAVSVVVPGFVADTEFGRFPDISRVTIQADSGPYADTFADYVAWIRSDGWEGAAQSRWEVADVVIDTLDRPAPAFRVPTSGWVRDYLAHKLADVDGNDLQARAHTWIGAPAPRLLSVTR